MIVHLQSHTASWLQLTKTSQHSTYWLLRWFYRLGIRTLERRASGRKRRGEAPDVQERNEDEPGLVGRHHQSHVQRQSRVGAQSQCGIFLCTRYSSSFLTAKSGGKFGMPYCYHSVGNLHNHSNFPQQTCAHNHRMAPLGPCSPPPPSSTPGSTLQESASALDWHRMRWVTSAFQTTRAINLVWQY